MLTLIALAFTWLVVIPLLIFRPPRFIAGLRLRWSNNQHSRSVKAVVVKPPWIKEGVPGVGRMVEVPAGKMAVVAVVNRKSGGQLGVQALSVLKSLLSPQQVIDVTDCGDLSVALKRYRGNVRVLVCGGDGTVAATMSAAATPLPIAVMPLGTGNDLSRSFGWGGGFGMSDLGKEEVCGIIHNVTRATPSALDRWFVQIQPRDGGAVKTMTMMNYFSVGVDAEIAIKFHQERKDYPERFSSQTKNVLKYTMLGFEASFQGVPLDGAVRITGDGEVLPIHPLWKGVIVSNVPCYQGGKDFWGKPDGDSFGPVNMCDGQLEVMGLAGTLHIGMCNLTFDSAHRVGQSKRIVVNIVKETAVQLDGEPWLQEPATLTFTHMGRYPMLQAPQE
jgi:diacylglycerol kinase (ATP)